MNNINKLDTIPAPDADVEIPAETTKFLLSWEWQQQNATTNNAIYQTLHKNKFPHFPLCISITQFTITHFTDNHARQHYGCSMHFT